MWSKDIFSWQVTERDKVRTCDLIRISSWSIFSNFLIPSLLSLNRNRSSHYSPSLSPSQVMSALFPQIPLISLVHPLCPSPPSYPLHHLALHLSLSLLFQAAGVTYQLTLLQPRSSFQSLASGLIGVR